MNPPILRLPVDFADPWEHLRLLSDRGRNDALLTLLERRAKGARVLEVGCGTGLLSVVAARLGAEHVYAVEVTELADRARALVEANGLGDRVTVIQAKLEDLEPTPCDLVFSELLNADPYYEGVLPAMAAATKWLAPGGTMSPRRLAVHVALAWVDEPSDEYTRAHAEVKRICGAHMIDAGPLVESLTVRHPHRYTTNAERAISTVAVAFDHPIGAEAPPDRATVEVYATVDGAVGGAIVWFTAEIDDDVWMGNPPGYGSHWGQMVCGWPRTVQVEVGQPVRLDVQRIGAELVVTPAA